MPDADNTPESNPAQDPESNDSTISVPAGELRLRVNYSDDFSPAGISWVGISRINADVQLDLGFINYQRAVVQLQGGKSENPTMDVSVSYSAYLTMSAFLQLHREVNKVFGMFEREGRLRDASNS